VMELYPFSRLSAPADVQVMPGLQSANLSAKMLRELAGNAVIGPMLVGMEKPVQLAPMTALAPEVLTLAVLAAAGVVACSIPGGGREVARMLAGAVERHRACAPAGRGDRDLHVVQ